MARSGMRARTAGRRGQNEARRRILDAAQETLKERGFTGTSARAIAESGGFAQSLVFYHFGTIADLLLAVLDETSERRMARYREALTGVGDLADLVATAAAVYREDLEAGHITVLAELIAATSAIAGLGEEVTARIEPWVELTEEALGKVLEGSPLAQMISGADLAYAIVALYLGLELLTHLDGDRSRAERLFDAAAGVASGVGALLAPNDGGRGRVRDGR